MICFFSGNSSSGIKKHESTLFLWFNLIVLEEWPVRLFPYRYGQQSFVRQSVILLHLSRVCLGHYPYVFEQKSASTCQILNLTYKI